MNELRPVILAVDDTPENLDQLIEFLSGQYKVKVASDGHRAMKLATSGPPPDMILLDIMMPGMDGIEVCRRLKAYKQLQDVPIIFISALEDVSDKIKAFTSGGVDYVTKPFQAEELKARVSTHLALREMQKQLEAHNNHLDELVRQKNLKLAEAHERLAIADQTKGEFLRLISHELRTPANGILGIADVILESCSDNEDVKALRPYFDESRNRMLSVLDDALLLAKVDFAKKDFEVVPVLLSEILSQAYDTASAFAGENEIKLSPMPVCEAWVDGDAQLLKKAIAALIKTAVTFTKPHQTVDIRYVDGTESITLIVEGHGKFLKQDSVDGFFDISSSVRSSTYAEVLGLMPVVAERVIFLYGGSVQIKNLDAKGVALYIRIKKSSPRRTI